MAGAVADWAGTGDTLESVTTVGAVNWAWAARRLETRNTIAGDAVFMETIGKSFQIGKGNQGKATAGRQDPTRQHSTTG